MAASASVHFFFFALPAAFRFVAVRALPRAGFAALRALFFFPADLAALGFFTAGDAFALVFFLAAERFGLAAAFAFFGFAAAGAAFA
jgi:hypothetical protein